MRKRPVGVGFIGAGSVLWAYLQLLDRLVPRGLALEGPICARRQQVWPRILDRRPDAELVSSPVEVVTADVEVVVVITSAGSHAELARLALEHGKHVLVEKPFASTRAEAEKLVNLARQQGLHLLAAPFVHLAPTFRAFWTEITAGAIGHMHSARGLYGIAPPDWNSWMYDVGPLADLGIYNLKTLTALLGPIVEVSAAEATVAPTRIIGGSTIEVRIPDVIHLTARHTSGALSSIVASWEIHNYRRPGLEVYGTEGTAYLLGDDWNPCGYQIWKTADAVWRERDSVDPTWLWTDGLRELVMSVHEDRDCCGDIEQDLHLLDVVQAARLAASSRRAVAVTSRFDPLDLRLQVDEGPSGHLHDPTRSPAEQR